MLTAADLAAYAPEWTEPLHTTYRGYDVYSNPATSRGGFEVLMGANLIEAVDLKAAGAGLAGGAARGDRSDQDLEGRHLPLRRRSGVRDGADRRPAVARRSPPTRRALFDPAKAIAYPPAGAPEGSPTTSPRAQGPAFDERYDGELHTTSFSIVDAFGNAVGVTPTLGGLFGNNVVVGSTGLLLNNGMRLGSTSPYPTDANYVGAGKIPILNNSPVVVLKDGKLAFVFGTPGGETIGQTEFQVLVNLVDFGMPVQQAIEAPRLVLERRRRTSTSPARPSPCRSKAACRRRPSTRSRPWATPCEVLPGWGSLGHMQVIRVDPKTGAMTAGADPRRTGYAMGY